MKLGWVGRETPIIIITLHLVELSSVELRVDQYTLILNNRAGPIIFLNFYPGMRKKDISFLENDNKLNSTVSNLVKSIFYINLKDTQVS